MYLIFVAFKTFDCMVKLTIGLPVYNGDKTLAETLDSVFRHLPNDVEVLISDNASSDRTAEIVRSYSEKYPGISYYKNEKNLGPDINFDLVVKRASGEFVWILGDDDEIAENGISCVMNVISKHSMINAIFVNYSIYDRDTNECLNPRVLKIKNDVLCVDASNFLNTVTVYPNFISSIIVRKSQWVIRSSSEFFGTYWLQYAMLMKVVEGGQSYCISFPYVINRGKEYDGPNEANRSGVAIAILMNLVDIIETLPRSVFVQSAISNAKNEAHKFLLRKIFSAKRRGLLLDRKLLMRLINTFGMYPSFWFIELPLLFFPKIFHYYSWRVYKSKTARALINFFRTVGLN